MAKKPKARDIIADYQRIVGGIRAKRFKPVYLLMGEEPYFIDKISNMLASDVIGDSEKAFNLTVMYGKDTKADAAITACRRYPMMSEHQVIVIKEAQDMDLGQFDVYFKAPLNSTILVICYKNKLLDKRSAVYKSALKCAEVFESHPFYESEVPEWISSIAEEQGLAIQEKATILLTEFLGNDLSKISQEFDKLKTVLPSGKTQISADDIERNVGISKDYNIFELCNAIGTRDFAKSYNIVEHFAQAPKNHPFVLTINQLYSYFTKILKLQMLLFSSKRPGGKALTEADKLSTLKLANSFFLRDYESAAKRYSASQSVKAIEYIREYDLKSKGIGNTTLDDSDLLKELIFKIMH